MSEEKRISRADLYEPVDVSDQELDLPEMEFEFVEVDNNEAEEIEKETRNDEEMEQPEEFEFSLFSTDRGRSEKRTVTLREPSPETIKNERPESYYFVKNDEEKKHEFAITAITFDQLFDSVVYDDAQPWRVVDLKKHNEQAEGEKKRKRPGMKKRANKIACRERKTERAKIVKKEVKEQEKKLLKKKFHKRGGQKHKKTKEITKGKPKYKTE